MPEGPTAEFATTGAAVAAIINAANDEEAARLELELLAQSDNGPQATDPV